MTPQQSKAIHTDLKVMPVSPVRCFFVALLFFSELNFNRNSNSRLIVTGSSVDFGSGLWRTTLSCPHQALHKYEHAFQMTVLVTAPMMDLTDLTGWDNTMLVENPLV